MLRSTARCTAIDAAPLLRPCCPAAALDSRLLLWEPQERRVKRKYQGHVNNHYACQVGPAVPGAAWRLKCPVPTSAAMACLTSAGTAWCCQPLHGSAACWPAVSTGRSADVTHLAAPPAGLLCGARPGPQAAVCGLRQRGPPRLPVGPVIQGGGRGGPCHPKGSRGCGRARSWVSACGRYACQGASLLCNTPSFATACTAVPTCPLVQVVGVLRGRPSAAAPGPGHCDVVLSVDASMAPDLPLMASCAHQGDGSIRIWAHEGWVAGEAGAGGVAQMDTS